MRITTTTTTTQESADLVSTLHMIYTMESVVN